MVGMRDRGLGATRNDDEIAIPRRELLELREQLLPLGAALNALDPLLRVARRQVEACDDGLLRAPSRPPRSARAASRRAREAVGRPELRVEVDARAPRR